MEVEKVQTNKTQCETGSAERCRSRWYQLWLRSPGPPSPPNSLADAPVTPLQRASLLSILTYAWLTPLMMLGWQRPLQAPDLWRVRAEDEVAPLSRALDEAWARRVERSKTEPVGQKWWSGSSSNEPSLAMALNDVLGRQFWIGGLFKVGGDIGRLMIPLLTKAIIKFAQERSRDGPSASDVGRGIGLAIGLPVLAIFASICTYQSIWRPMCTGVLARGALIASLYSRGLQFRPGQDQHDLLNHVSVDVSRIETCAQWFHSIWTAPLRILICLILLYLQLGPAALAGFSLFAFLIPVQELLMSYQLGISKQSMTHTDARASLLRELLSNMRIVKIFSYEAQFHDRLDKTRKHELAGVRSMMFIKAANQAVAFAIPTLAAVLSFVVYAAAHNEGLDPAIIFPSMGLFQLLRQPLMFLPRALSSMVDAQNALERLKHVFLAETIGDQVCIDPDQQDALVIRDAEFAWFRQAESVDGQGREPKKDKESERDEKGSIEQSSRPIAFRVTDVSMNVPRGSLVAIIGPVGCGKSSLILGLLGEMPRTQGIVTFAGKVAYCSQMAWIQNATLRDNIVFGRSWDEERYWSAIRDASLERDLELLADGDLTEIGEKGINLSGGQRQRVNLARALYDDSAEVFLLDDPFSAVDAHVGHALFNNAILNNLKARGKTVLLVTHAIHFLSAVDHIYILGKGGLNDPKKMEADLHSHLASEDELTLSGSTPTAYEFNIDGECARIAERGTYAELLSAGGTFARLVEFGSGEGQLNATEDEKSQPKDLKPVIKEGAKTAGIGGLEGKLLQAEKRTIGSVKWAVYGRYITYGRGWITLPIVIFCILLAQGCYAVNNFWLVWWANDSLDQPMGVYMAGYAVLGVGYAVFMFIMGISLGYLSYRSSKRLYSKALDHVFHAPMFFFDTTPLGRVLGIFGKDVDTIDNQLADAIRMFIFTISPVITSVIIITILQYYFIAIAIAILVLYQYLAVFYRASAREIKRLDASLRGVLYSHFSESLTGLATIRAYGQVSYFLQDNKHYIDLENRALLLVVANQQWLAIRLDLLGAILVFSVALMAIVGAQSISPSEIGLVISTLTGIIQTIGLTTKQSAEVENYMNSVERLLHYTKNGDVPQEKPYVVVSKAPPKNWPHTGAIEFRDLHMSYRPGLPPVLRGVSLTIRGGEKIAVVGRTGAGKSSLMAALFRIVELDSGTILIDDLDIAQMGLSVVRSNIAIIPQEAGIFSGTIRSNMDPFNEFDDATLHDALRRSHLLGDESKLSPSTLGLDSPITAEGANLSVGQRSLLSLARALVKQSKILVLDEATASVDVETDSKIQMTIKTEFADRTLLCIAHRLRTIINYDRVVVMDQGKVVEVGTPLELYQNGGAFRSMCEQSGIDGEEITRSRRAL